MEIVLFQSKDLPLKADDFKPGTIFFEICGVEYLRNGCGQQCKR